MANDPSQFAKTVAAEMAKLQADGSRASIQQLKGTQQGILADARAVLVEQKAGVAQAQELLRRETAIAKEKARGEALAAAERAKADIQASQRAQKKRDGDESAQKRADAQAEKEQKKREKERADAIKRQAAEGAKSQAEQQKALDAEMKAFGSAGDKFLDSAASAGKYVAASALAIVAAGAALVKSGVEYGVQVSSAKRNQEEALRNLTKNFGGEKRGVEQGDVAYRITMSLAGEKGVDPATALERVRGLIDAKIGRKDTEVYFKVAADLDAVKGAGAGEALLSQFEALKRLDAKLKDQRGRRDYKGIQLEEGNAQATALDALADRGVKASEVLQLLAAKGESLKSVSLRLRRGKVDMDEFLRAAAKVADKGMEGVAGRGLDATLNRLKIGFANLFSDWDLGPIDEAGAKLDSVLKGEDGAELKAALKDIGRAALDVLKNISKDDIKSAFASASDAAHSLASGIRRAADAASDLVKFGKDIGLIGEGVSKAPGAHKFDVGKDGADTGKQLMEGMAKGIADNAGRPASAAEVAVGATIAAGNAKAGIFSPSRVAAQSGKYYDEGWELGIKQHADKPARAAAGMVGGVTGAGAAAGALGGAGASSGGGGGGNVYHYSPQITISGGAAPTSEAIRSALADDYPRWLSWARQMDRDRRETLARV